MVAHATWHLLLEGSALVVLALSGAFLMARAPRLRRSTAAIAVRPTASPTAIAFTAAAALAGAGAIHWAAAGGHSFGTVLGPALTALAVLQIVAAALLILRPRSTAAVAAIAALAGLAGWAWTATAGAGLDGHSAWEFPALATVGLQIVALAATVMLRLGRRARAAIGRNATLVWAAAVPIAGVAFLVTLLALTQGTAAHVAPALPEPAPSHGH